MFPSFPPQGIPCLLLQVDVYAFAMIAYELFEGKKPFGNINPIEAARRASMDKVRPEWGKWGNQCASCFDNLLANHMSLSWLYSDPCPALARCLTLALMTTVK